MGYHPTDSGLLTGGGQRRFKVRRNVLRGGNLTHFPDVHISNTSAVKRLVPDFDPDLEFEYTKRELILLAEKILLQDEKPPYEHPVWHNAATAKERFRHEVYCASGVPEPHVMQGIYWRTHPEGRSWVPENIRRATGKSFYSSGGAGVQGVPAPPSQKRQLCSFEGCDYPIASKRLGLCQAHTGQAHLNIPLRPVKRHIGKSKLAEHLEAQIERKSARANHLPLRSKKRGSPKGASQ